MQRADVRRAEINQQISEAAGIWSHPERYEVYRREQVRAEQVDASPENTGERVFFSKTESDTTLLVPPSVQTARSAVVDFTPRIVSATTTTVSAAPVFTARPPASVRRAAAEAQGPRFTVEDPKSKLRQVIRSQRGEL